jgi:hypothetical protein
MIKHITIIMNDENVYYFDDCFSNYNESHYSVIINVDGKTKQIERFPFIQIYHIVEEF